MANNESDQGKPNPDVLSPTEAAQLGKLGALHREVQDLKDQTPTTPGEWNNRARLLTDLTDDGGLIHTTTGRLRATGILPAPEAPSVDLGPDRLGSRIAMVGGSALSSAAVIMDRGNLDDSKMLAAGVVTAAVGAAAYNRDAIQRAGAAIGEAVLGENAGAKLATGAGSVLASFGAVTDTKEAIVGGLVAMAAGGAALGRERAADVLEATGDGLHRAGEVLYGERPGAQLAVRAGLSAILVGGATDHRSAIVAGALTTAAGARPYVEDGARYLADAGTRALEGIKNLREKGGEKGGKNQI